MKKNNLYIILNNPLYISIFLFVVLCYIALWPYMGYDEGLWTYIGRVWNRNGIRPYIGVVENKTPGVLFLYALSDYLFKGSILFIRIIGVLSVVISSNILFLIVKKLHTQQAGVFSMYIYGFTMSWIMMDGFAFAQTETFMVLFSIISFYFIILGRDTKNINLWLFLSGISMGFAIAFKQIALTTFIALTISFLVLIAKNSSKKHKLFGIFLMGSGVIASTLFTYFILFINGVPFNDYIEGAWLILLNSGSRTQGLKDHFNNFITIFLSSRITCFYPFVVLFFLQRKRKYLKSEYFWILIIWLCFDFIGVNASGYYYGHQIKQLIPVLAIITSIVLVDIINEESYKDVIKKYSTKFIIAIIILFFPYEQLIRTTNLLLNVSQAPYEEIGNWIKGQTEESDYIYIIGNDSDLIKSLSFSNRISSSKYLNSLFINGEKERSIVYSDLMNKPPKFILKEENDTLSVKRLGKEITKLVNDHYSSFTIKKGAEILKRN
ncbi:ArnT family glycosyltransferase [Flavivirga spongiicola]|uniref:Glycosyltransferase family 39 protein n=1 Tax=Flavivirga spongiicola TaxID=421621 RepID=A0ABU7XN27_9FLAO|nr:glycosyltransferase family 39 protein [Flavivirga sp. MEBiC05379]MDO5981809.1 glycosyltransferase family 39 protein [Flavivirga sp. MEBiC05379]